jgi:4'-phosphopantetheinyl transferase
MPLLRLENITDACSWALWEISEEAGELMEMLQPPANDLEYFATIRHPHKQLEWLASRLAAKKLVENWGGHYQGIVKNIYNKPFLKDLPFCLSLSHTGQYGAAILHRNQKVGIDIEYNKDKLHKIQHKFLSPAEMDNAEDCVNKLSVYWCAKEALYKLHIQKQLSFKQHIRIEPFDLQTEGKLDGHIATENGQEDFNITYRQFSPLTIAYAY